MKKTFKLLIFLFCCVAQSQVLVKKDLPDIKLGLSLNQKIDNLFFSNDKLYTSILLGERYVPQTNSMQRNYVLKETDGNEIMLTKNEYPIQIIGTTLYTFTENAEKHERQYTTYTISNNTLNKISSATFSISSTASVLKNGDLVITEGGHSGRDWIALYSKGLKELHKFAPFNDECNISYDANENYIAYVGQINKDPKVRVALYGAFANKGFVGSQEIDIDENLILSSIKVVQERIVLLFSSTISGHSQILILDKDFKTINKIQLKERASYNKIVGIKNDFFINTNTTIYSFNIEKGEKKWELKKDIPKAIKTKYGYKFRGSNLYALDDSYLLLLDANYEDKVQAIKGVSIKIIDTSTQKNLQKIIINQIFIGDLKLEQSKKDIIIYASNNFLRYEKQ